MNSKSGRIMVVEDAPDIRDLMGRVFSSNGYEVILAKDGKDALEKLRAEQSTPSLILLDLMMPGMDGFEFRAEQEKDAKLAEIPVILLTADANAHEKSIQVGAKGYIRKPVDIKTLLAAAEKYCRKT